MDPFLTSLSTYGSLLILLLLSSNDLLLANAQGISRRSSGKSSSSSAEGTDSGGLDEAFGNLITKMFQSWKFATLGMAIFGCLFALILDLVSIQSVCRYHISKRGVKNENNRRRRGELGEKKNDSNEGSKGKTCMSEGRDRNQNQTHQADEGSRNPPGPVVEEPKPKPTDPKLDKSTWNTSSAFCWLSFAGSCSLSAYYPLFIVNQINVDGDTWAPIPVEGLMILTSSMADITIACAFLALMRRRVWVHLSPATLTNTIPQSTTPSDVDKSVEPPNSLPILPISSPRSKLTLDGVIIFLMTSLAITNTVIACLHATYTSEGRLKLLGHLIHVYRASYFLVTIDVIGSAFLLHKALARAGIQDELVSYTLCVCVCPLLGLQAVFWLLDEIIRAAVPAKAIKQDALATVEVAIVFVCYTWALSNGLAGFSPKKSK